jgi:hypothetical protein
MLEAGHSLIPLARIKRLQKLPGRTPPGISAISAKGRGNSAYPRTSGMMGMNRNGGSYLAAARKSTGVVKGASRRRTRPQAGKPGTAWRIACGTPGELVGLYQA